MNKFRLKLSSIVENVKAEIGNEGKKKRVLGEEGGKYELQLGGNAARQAMNKNPFSKSPPPEAYISGDTKFFDGKHSFVGKAIPGTNTTIQDSR